MRFSAIAAAIFSVGAALVQGEVITVKVGENNTLTYNPSSVNATVGDTLFFEFLSKNHTITQSTFAAPCSNFTFPNGTTGLDSGFQFVAANATNFPGYSFTITNASAPLWFYCRQTGHCENGMVFAVNPTAQKSFTAFQAAAMATNANTTNSTSSASPSSSGSKSAPSPSASTAANGAGAVRLGGAAVLLSVAGVVAGVLL
ncbi:hypothetical protein AcW2_004876 [Taiwanofungus camphoratus]|nr:hypothetical protein AcW2_004876 [Antrodia cinnamomea]KAI0929066.1 hypothetical protein AcW2_004876 [Antrodia cinnamomea]